MTTAVSDGIQYPSMRSYMVEALESLADVEYQQRVWIDHILPFPTYYDEFTNSINILFDDTMVCGEDSDGSLGTILFEDELEPIRLLGLALEDILADEALDTDLDYLSDLRWPGIVALAAAALRKVRENGEGLGPRNHIGTEE